MTAYRASALYGNGNGNSITGAYPTGTATGDFVIAAFYKESDDAITTITPSDFVAVSPAAGWECNVASQNFKLHVYVRVFTSGDANPNFAWTTSVWRDACWASYSGSTAALADYADGAANANIASSAGTAITFPSITTGQDNTFSILFPSNFNGSTYGTPSTYTSRQAGARDVGLFDKAITPAGAAAPGNSTISSAAWIGAHATLRDAPPAGAVNSGYYRARNRAVPRAA